MFSSLINEFMLTLRRLQLLRFTDMPTQLNQGEFATLLFIKQHSEKNGNNDNKAQGISLNAVAKWHNVSPAMISKICRTIEKKGYIRRITDSTDRRGFMVSLTDKGNKTIKSDIKTVDDILKKAYNEIGKDKMVELIQLNTELCETMEKQIALANQQRKDDAHV